MTKKQRTTRTTRGKVKEVAFPTGETWWTFYCPGCKKGHTINNTWDFDGNYEAPTFSPSVLTYGSPWEERRCHSFVRSGHIEFLSDCTHELAGQTVALPPLPERLRAEA